MTDHVPLVPVANSSDTRTNRSNVPLEHWKCLTSNSCRPPVRALPANIRKPVVTVPALQTTPPVATKGSLPASVVSTVIVTLPGTDAATVPGDEAIDAAIRNEATAVRTNRISFPLLAAAARDSGANRVRDTHHRDRCSSGALDALERP